MCKLRKEQLYTNFNPDMSSWKDTVHVSHNLISNEEISNTQASVTNLEHSIFVYTMRTIYKTAGLDIVIEIVGLAELFMILVARRVHWLATTCLQLQVIGSLSRYNVIHHITDIRSNKD